MKEIKMEQTSPVPINRQALCMPINIIAVYLIASIILYFWGPIKWNIDNGFSLFIYLIVNYAAIIVGYRRTMNRYERADSKSRIRGEMDKEKHDDYPYYINAFTLLLIFTILSHCMYSHYVYGGIRLDRISNIAKSYLDNRDYEPAYNAITRFFTYFWGLNYFYLPCGIVLYKRLNRFNRILLYAAICSNVLFWLSIGTMKGLGDILITTMIPLICVSIRGGKNAIDVKKTLHKKKVVLAICLIIFLIIFGYSAANRLALRGRTTYSALNKHLAPFATEEVLWPFPYITNSIIVYITHGYTGLSYALKLPFKWTYMVGSSRALSNIIERTLLNAPGVISNLTYVQRLEDVYAWTNGSIWPTAFTWLASDFSFVFIPLVMYGMGRLWAKCVYEAIVKHNLASLVMASYLTIFFIYLPCNNQLVQSERSFWTLVLISVVYVLNTSRKTITVGRYKLRL